MLLAVVDHRVVRSLVRLLATVTLAGCIADPVAPTRAPDGAPALAKAAVAGGPAVSSTLPTSGDQAQTLDVHVYGSGFGPDAAAEWALHGVPDPAKVRTNKTTFVSSTEVIANVTIASNATIAYWDVRVKTGGKTGVGTELFEVTTATPISGASSAYTVNDAGDIAGDFASGAWVLLAGDGSFSGLGQRQARGISADGLTITGGIPSTAVDGVPMAGVWTRAPGGTWPNAGMHLPDPLGMAPGGGLANGIATIAAEGVTVITGTLKMPAAFPVYWQSTDGTWTAPAHLLPVPSAYTSSSSNWALTIAAASGDIGGYVTDAAGNNVPILWRRVAGSYVTDVLPLPSGYPIGRVQGISPDGTIMAGYVRASVHGKQVFAPSVWTRNAGNGAYAVQLLPTLSGAYSAGGAAFGVTVVGTQARAVGTSPPPTTGTFMHAVLWTWTLGASDFQVRDLGGLGKKTDVQPNAINPSGTIAVGGDATSTAIKWRLP